MNLTTRSKAVLALLTTLVAVPLASGIVLPASAAASPPPYCGIYWGSLPEHRTSPSTGQLVDVRTGRHACFDRLVLDIDGPVAGYLARYVSHVHQDGSGFTVPVHGGAKLELILDVPVVPDDSSFFGPGRNLADVSGFTTFRQVAWVGSFEGQSTIGLGVRARLPFRVFRLDGPGDASRVVVDVAHHW